MRISGIPPAGGPLLWLHTAQAGPRNTHRQTLRNMANEWMNSAVYFWTLVTCELLGKKKDISSKCSGYKIEFHRNIDIVKTTTYINCDMQTVPFVEQNTLITDIHSILLLRVRD